MPVGRERDRLGEASGGSELPARSGALAGGTPSLAAEPPRKRPPKKTLVSKLPAVVESAASDRELLREVVDYCHQTLWESEEALAYLEKRGIRDEELIKRFRLGFANRTLSYRLPSRNQRTGGQLREALERVGIFRASGHEHLNRLAHHPGLRRERRGGGAVRAENHHALAQRDAAAPVLAGSHRGVWNWQALRETKEVILCESLNRCVHILVCGLSQRDGSVRGGRIYGDHWAAFERRGIERVRIAFDRTRLESGRRKSLGRSFRSVGWRAAGWFFRKEWTPTPTPWR